MFSAEGLEAALKIGTLMIGDSVDTVFSVYVRGLGHLRAAPQTIANDSRFKVEGWGTSALFHLSLNSSSALSARCFNRCALAIFPLSIVARSDPEMIRLTTC